MFNAVLSFKSGGHIFIWTQDEETIISMVREAGNELEEVLYV